MARMGTGFFDAKGHYFKTPDEATISDLSAILGKIGDGESLAPGIAHTLLHRRSEIEQLFTDHDRMLAEYLHTFINTFRQREVLSVILNVPDQTPPLVLANLDTYCTDLVDRGQVVPL